MKTLILQRDKETQYSDLGTKGTISENGIKICDTLELHEENNKKRESHIPVGKYLCKIVNSPKFGKVYEITNVPNRGNILIGETQTEKQDWKPSIEQVNEIINIIKVDCVPNCLYDKLDIEDDPCLSCMNGGRYFQIKPSKYAEMISKLEVGNEH